MTKLQFAVLYREFLFRMFDIELLSPDAMGDARKLLGRFASLLVFISIFLAIHAFEFAGIRASPAATMLQAWRFEHVLISTSMLVVGLFAVLSWDAMLPDHRDVLVLGPLPVRAGTLFLAKVLAVGTALGLAVVLLHAAAGLIWPLALSDPAGWIRSYLVYWITMFTAGAFIFCCALGLQGIAAQFLPRRVFLRASSSLQLTAFCIIVTFYMLQPLMPTMSDLDAANGGGVLGWSPSYWFLGLFQQLSGSPALGSLARRAWLGLAATVSLTALAYLLCYRRTLRKIVEEPDIVPSRRGGVWLPPFGSGVRTAIVHFSVRTLLRSRLHRLILTFYLGMGFAFLILLLRRTLGQAAGLPGSVRWGQVNGVVLAASAVIMAFSAIGTRVIFSLPVDLRANWIFRATGVHRVPECQAAARYSLLLLSAAPLWAASAALSFWFSAWRAAAGQAAILALVALLLAELCLLGFDKIPFTCSYLPGKSQLHIAVLASAYMLWVIGLNSTYEAELLQNPATMVGLTVALVAVWACVRWRNAVHSGAKEAEVQFEEFEPPAVQGLGLTYAAFEPVVHRK
jgi:hypothetical protein